MSFDQNTLILSLAGFSIFLFIWNIIQQISIYKTKKKQLKLFQGKQAKNLEQIILNHHNQISQLDEQLKQLSKLTNQINILSNVSLNKVGMVRFNPFKNLGGNQSFSVAFLNSHLNGLVISSIYHENNSRFYAKTINNGKSQKQYPLTEEEKQAISTAIGKKGK